MMQMQRDIVDFIPMVWIEPETTLAQCHPVI